ncbi:hypothetical protein DFH08DRAFT_976400 [Mycena albidolilacea]|uniref:Uncharacterized protein n=1 Tax=Mycena albidolilacea TaxID=1033008 RepID=A0AAD7EAC5_9AGAR|nr:hypothetical protein DFH08DRAFT_976400 [Mycena albidolilacea]
MIHGGWERSHLFTDAVDINYIGYGGPGFSDYLLVKVDAAESLTELRPDVDFFGPGRKSSSSHPLRGPGIAYETRMLAPSISVRKGHACGSAHCPLCPPAPHPPRHGSLAADPSRLLLPPPPPPPRPRSTCPPRPSPTLPDTCSPAPFPRPCPSRSASLLRPRLRQDA